jgi:polyhydroxybutyrate depolymerase
MRNRSNPSPWSNDGVYVAVRAGVITAALFGGIGLAGCSAFSSESTPCIRFDDDAFEVMTFSGGSKRRYLLHTPTPRPQGPAPLLMAFHGAGQGAKELQVLTGFDRIGDSLGMYVAYPAACDVSGTWKLELGATDMDLVKGIVDRLTSSGDVDGTRVYAVGLSRGGQFAHRLGCELPQHFAAISSVAGQIISTIASSCTPGRAVPGIFFHGTDDLILLYDGAISGSVRLFSAPATLDFWAGIAGCTGVPDTTAVPDVVGDSTTVERLRYSACNAGAEVVLYSVNGGGHTWPGRGSDGALGRSTGDIDASQLVADFLLRFSK